MQDFLKYGIYSLNMDFDAQKMDFGNTIEVKNKNKQKWLQKRMTIMNVAWKISPGVLQLFFMLTLTQQLLAF